MREPCGGMESDGASVMSVKYKDQLLRDRIMN